LYLEIYKSKTSRNCTSRRKNSWRPNARSLWL